MPIKTHQIVKDDGGTTIKLTGSTHPSLRRAITMDEERRRGIRIPLSLASDLRESKEIALVDHIIVPSRFVEESYLHHGVDATKLHIVPFGVDTQKYVSTPAPTGEFVAFFSGQNQHRKGLLDLLEAWQKAGINGTLIIAGNLQPEVRETVRQYQHVMNIELPGFVDQREYFKRAHLFVFPSLEDGFALVVTEAMASGRPVLISDHTGAKDFVHEGKDGFIVPAGDVNAIAAKLRFAYDNRQLLAKMGKAARKSIEKNTWDTYAQALVRTFKKCSA